MNKEADKEQKKIEETFKSLSSEDLLRKWRYSFLTNLERLVIIEILQERGIKLL